MHLYSPQGYIKKYNNIEEIMRDYYEVRLNIYIKRREYQLNILEFELNMISYKVKFILMIINKEIDINNKKKVDIESILIKNNFPKLGKTKNDNNISYDYLLTMPIYNLTFEKIEELNKQEKDKETEYNILKNKTINNMWLEELDLLEEKYIKFINKKIDNTNITKLKKIKK
jgi:DNA topoisomerase-2